MVALIRQQDSTHDADPVRLGIAVAAVSELIDAARLAGGVRSGAERVERAGVRLAVGSLLVAATRRLDWRTPALTMATLASLPAGRRGAVRALALAGLLRESWRADRWEWSDHG
jgi:hypothetical protein